MPAADWPAEEGGEAPETKAGEWKREAPEKKPEGVAEPVKSPGKKSQEGGEERL